MSFWSRLFGRKESQARIALAMNQIGQPVSTPRNYEAFSREGYQVNVIAYKCVSIVSRAASSVKWGLFSKARTGMDATEIESHPLLDLLKNPNPMQGQSPFFESVIAYYMIAGNSYIESVGPSLNAPPMELWSIRPDKMKVIPGSKGMPMAYEFTAASRKIIFPVDQVSGDSQVLHLKTFHPTDNWYGMSSIESAVYSIDQHNESGRWNTSLLQNMATPAGVITVKQDAANPMGTLPDAQFANMKEMIRDKLEGSKNAGKTLLLEGGMDWKQMGLSPKDMDWIEGRKMAARDIALAFGVPPIILNIPGDSTFANYKEARLSLYEDTILPLMDNVQSELNQWLVPRFGDQLELRYDPDSIPALEAKKAEKFTLISSAGYLTINEKRAAVGYEPLENGDVVLVASAQMTLDDLFVEDEPVITDPAPIPPTDDSLEVPPEDAEEGEEEESEDGNGGNDGDEDIGDEDEKFSNHTFNPTEVKQINPLGKRDRARVWRQINRQRNVMSDALYRDLKEEFDAMAVAVGKSVDGVESRLAEFAALKTISDFTPKFKKILTKHFQRALALFGEPILQSGKAFSPADEVKNRARFLDYQIRYTELHVAESIQQIEGTNIKKARNKIKRLVADSLEQGDSTPNLRDALTQEFAGLSESRARTIATTEVGIASNQGALEAAKALEIPDLKKEWVPVVDDRTRDGSHTGEADHVSMSGKRADLNENFLVEIAGYAPVEMTGPGDPAGGPENVCNCRCVLTYSRG